MKLSRKALEEAAKELPISAILGKTASNGLTTKQKNFARAVAMGATKADAYRASYDVTSRRTMAGEPYRLAADPRIAREVEAYELALESAKLRSPAALRELVIQSLVKVIVDPDSKPGQITAAAKVLGTVTEVAAFTERKEVRTISSSEDARAKVMQELRALVSGGAEDATVIEADSLLQELTGETVNINASPADNINAGGEADTSADNINADAAALEESGKAGNETPPYPDPPTV